jgi:hypothetical protein
MTRPERTLLALGAAIAALILAAPLFHQPGSIWAGALWRKDTVLGLLGVATLFYLTAVLVVLRAKLPPRTAWFVVGLALAVRLALVAVPPFMSSDIYRYAWDGHVQTAGFNPYRYIAADPALAALRDTSIYPNINRLDYAHTIYPPAAQLIFWAAGSVNYSIAGTKLALLLVEAAGMLAMLRVLALAGLPPVRILIYAWNPLGIWSAGADGHIDAAAIGFLGLALLARATGREGGRQALTGVLLSFAILVKFLPVVVAPALCRRWGWRLPAACAATIVALYALYIGAGWGVLGFLTVYTSEEGMKQGTGFWLLSALDRITTVPHWGSAAYVGACALALAAAALWMGFRQRVETGAAEIRRVCGNAAILAAGTMLAFSPHYAWYFPWLALPSCVVAWRGALALSCVPLILYCDPYHETLIFPTIAFVPAVICGCLDWYYRKPLNGVAAHAG